MGVSEQTWPHVARWTWRCVTTLCSRSCPSTCAWILPGWSTHHRYSPSSKSQVNVSTRSIVIVHLSQAPYCVALGSVFMRTKKTQAWSHGKIPWRCFTVLMRTCFQFAPDLFVTHTALTVLNSGWTPKLQTSSQQQRRQCWQYSGICSSASQFQASSSPQ